MAVCDLRCFHFTVMLLYCSVSQPVLDCPKPVACGDSAVLKCSNLKRTVSIRNPAGVQMGTCVERKCAITESMEEKMNVTFTNNTILLTVHNINSDDDGEWNCESEGKGSCFLHVYKLPSCEISSIRSTNNLTIGQDLTLNINLSDYYCKNSTAWNLKIGGNSQNITDFQKREETENIINKVVTYSPTVTSSLTGRVKLTFICNDETYDVSCSGVEELKLRDPPSCHVTSRNDTGDLTIGNKLTLDAKIEEYHCPSGIEYALLSGSEIVKEFIRRDSLFYATFEVKPVYLDKHLHLEFTCNNVSATTRTTGVTILLTKGLHGMQFIIIVIIVLAIGLPVGTLVTVCVFRIICRKTSTKNDVPYSDVLDIVTGRIRNAKVTSDDTYTDVSVTQNVQGNHSGIYDANSGPKGNQCDTGDVIGGQKDLGDDKAHRPRSECIMVPNVAYVSIDDVR